MLWMRLKWEPPDCFKKMRLMGTKKTNVDLHYFTLFTRGTAIADYGLMPPQHDIRQVANLAPSKWLKWVDSTSYQAN